MHFNKLSAVLGMLLLMFSITSTAEPIAKTDSLPEPLTLDVALSLVDQQHPNLRLFDAEKRLAESTLQQAASSDDLSVNLKATASWIEPSILASNQSNEDHRLGLFVNKTLYDFGRTASKVDAEENNFASQSLYYLSERQRQYIRVMQSYFNVVLADLEFYRYNEEMAVAYIQYDRLSIREKLGQYTEVDVAEKKAEYERVRRLRTHSENQQRVTRSILAQALNRPDDLPATVARPALDDLSRQLPDFETLQKKVIENNPTLRALREQLAAANNNIQYARAGNKPTLSAGVESYAYSREIASSDKWRALLTLDVPLWSGDRVDADLAKAMAAVYKVEAQLAQQEFAAKQKALELWMAINTLKIKNEEVLAAMNFTELSLDKNRALYELEVQADLGYSMVLYSAAEREVVQTSFDIALAWAQLDALAGTLLSSNKKTTNHSTIQ